MADYRDKLEEWREAARRKARELDDKYGIRDRVEESARAAQDAAKRSAETINTSTERARQEAERFNQEYEVGQRAARAAEEAARAAREAREAFRQAGQTAGSKASEAFDEAKNYYERAANFYDASARLTRATAAATSALLQARRWTFEHPAQAVLVSLSIVGGVRLGASFPSLDAVLLGAHPHWLTHSALPVYGLRLAGEKFDRYLKEREQLLARGELTQAERQRVEFERKIVRYVGAPLLGAFSCAAGAALCAQVFQPGSITGAPISWLLGGNPFLDAVWLFGNGIICFQQGYKFFMIALKDQQQVNRIVRELKGLLSEASVAANATTGSPS